MSVERDTAVKAAEEYALAISRMVQSRSGALACKAMEVRDSLEGDDRQSPMCLLRMTRPDGKSCFHFKPIHCVVDSLQDAMLEPLGKAAAEVFRNDFVESLASALSRRPVDKFVWIGIDPSGLRCIVIEAALIARICHGSDRLFSHDDPQACAAVFDLMMMACRADVLEIRGRSPVDRQVFLGDRLDETRRLGQKLYRAGGEGLMFDIATQLFSRDSGELNHAWDGIGRWMS